MLNNVNIMGRICFEPEKRTTASGKSVVTLRIAVDDDFGKEKKANFFDVVCWRATADFVAKYFHKGMPILVSGRLSSREYEDKNGNKRVAIEIVADQVYFAGGQKADASNEATFQELVGDDSDLPWNNSDDALPL